MKPRCRSRGISLIELVVALGIGVVLLSIFVPYALKQRETNRRVICQNNLRSIAWALTSYAQGNRGIFPRVRSAVSEQPEAHTAFTGPDSADPFAADSAVEPNDVSASLWMLVRQGYIGKAYSPRPSVFICPSSDDVSDQLLNAAGEPVERLQRGNFRSARNLSYSYASPFGLAPGYGVHSFLQPDFVVLADKNPGRTGGADVTAVRADAPALDLARGNSRNHGGAGQYVLKGDMHVEWQATPFCGVEQDNIYTAQAERPVYYETDLPNLRTPGFVGKTVMPARSSDSYLLPMAGE